MKKIGLDTARSGRAHYGRSAGGCRDVGLPALFVRPYYGWHRRRYRYNREEFEEICERGLTSPTNEPLIDESPTAERVRDGSGA